MMSIITVVFGRIKKAFIYFIVFRYNHVSCLRYLGVRIGERCLISSSVENIGFQTLLFEIHNDVSITDGVNFLCMTGSAGCSEKILKE